MNVVPGRWRGLEKETFIASVCSSKTDVLRAGQS